MVRVNTITRAVQDYGREKPSDVTLTQRNYDKSLHPMEKAREYKRAVNAAKLDRVFAKPFVGAMDGHRDGIYSMDTLPQNVNMALSGAFDGEIRLWNLTRQRMIARVEKAHRGCVRGIASLENGDESFLSCGDDRIVKIYPLVALDYNVGDDVSYATATNATSTATSTSTGTDVAVPSTGRTGAHVVEATAEWIGTNAFSSVTVRRNSNTFATGGAERVDVWDLERRQPIHTYEWGTDSVTCVRFNRVEGDILASAATDRSVALYDLRGNTPIRKLVLTLKANAIAWNPIEPFNFAVASEDHNAYTFDMRRLDSALSLHKGHVAAVLDVAFSPTGQELVTGSYDRSIRIYSANQSHSRDIYHTRRMQRVFTVRYTNDARFILSGSDDANVRLWKANASEVLRPTSSREQRSLREKAKLRQRFASMPEVRAIEKKRHIPKPIHRAQAIKREMVKAEKRKEANRRAHSRPDDLEEQAPAKKKPVLGELV